MDNNGEETCIKEILLTDAKGADYFKLNKEKLIRKEGEESKTPIWESYLEYGLDLKNVLLQNDLAELLHEFDPNEVADDLPVSFIGVQLLVDQSYWEKVEQTISDLEK